MTWVTLAQRPAEDKSVRRGVENAITQTREPAWKEFTVSKLRF
jgi:hypothetical protein